MKRGITPADTVCCATVNAAELMVGTIGVEGDPLTDIAVLRHVAFVMKGGVVIKPLTDAR